MGNPAERGGPSHALPWVVVRAGNSRLGIPSAAVREMLALPQVARVPGLPPDIPGVITWRGRVVPVTDLLVRLDLAHTSTAATRRMAVVVSAGDDRARALAVDAIDGVESLEEGSVTALPEGLESHGRMVREYARLRRDGSLVLLLDLDETLGISRGSAAGTSDGPGADATATVDAPLAHEPGAEEPAPIQPAIEGPPDVTLPQGPLRPKAAAARRAKASGKGSRSPRRRTAS